ncbi:MAG: hypothetical protein C4525_12060 [Desulfarculus sp.]|nr:MAG: hypothetical protein C4525_12060 [Desulfarculus sp.]
MSVKKETPPPRPNPQEEAVLKAAKEIAVKFIETGRMSLAAFDEAFPQIYRAILNAVRKDKK